MTPENLPPVTRAEVEQIVARSQAQLIEAMREMQTEILRGFERYARGQFARAHLVESQSKATAEQIAATNDRITALEERVLELETRRPPL